MTHISQWIMIGIKANGFIAYSLSIGGSKSQKSKIYLVSLFAFQEQKRTVKSGNLLILSCIPCHFVHSFCAQQQLLRITCRFGLRSCSNLLQILLGWCLARNIVVSHFSSLFQRDRLQEQRLHDFIQIKRISEVRTVETFSRLI